MHEHELLKKILEDVHRNHELEERNNRLLHDILHRLSRPHGTPTSISFQEITMLPPVAGNTLVYTGTLAPAGAVFPSDSVFAVTSSDPTVTPTVDSTGLIVTIPLPSTFVDNPASPFTVGYTATSASTGMSLSAS